MKEWKIENSETWEISKILFRAFSFLSFLVYNQNRKVGFQKLGKKNEISEISEVSEFPTWLLKRVSFPWISAETVHFQKNSTPGNYVKFGYFAKYFLLICTASKKLFSSFKVWSYSLLLHISLKWLHVKVTASLSIVNLSNSDW